MFVTKERERKVKFKIVSNSLLPSGGSLYCILCQGFIIWQFNLKQSSKQVGSKHASEYIYIFGHVSQTGGKFRVRNANWMHPGYYIHYVADIFFLIQTPVSSNYLGGKNVVTCGPVHCEKQNFDLGHL